MNFAAALNYLLVLTQQLQLASQIIANAHKEERTKLTDEEWNQILAGDDAARAAAVAATAE